MSCVFIIFFDDFTGRITSSLCALNLLNSGIVHDDNSDTESEILSETVNGMSSGTVENSMKNCR